MNEKMILITRPQEAAEDMRADLQEKGWKSVVEPMMRIEGLPVKLPDLGLYDGLIFTSSNGVLIYENLTNYRDFPVYTVGKSTADAARNAGFKKVYEGPGTVRRMNRDLADKTALKGKKLLHLSGAHVAGKVRVAGVHIKRLPVYQAAAVNTLSPVCLAHLHQENFSGVMFFSSRTAEIFRELLGKYGRTDAVKSTKALCLSDSVAKTLSDLPWQDIKVARKPDRESMLALTDEIEAG